MSTKPTIDALRVRTAFPEVGRIGDDRLRALVGELWEWVSARNPVHDDIEAIPVHPTLPADRYGNLAQHIRAMATLAPELVQTYRERWRMKLDLDAFLTAVYVHDAAKVIEFVPEDGKLVATPGYNHAIECGRIARDLGFPEPIPHMISAHSFLGPLVVPRTREAQLFLFLDAICLPAFPELGDSSVVRHLRANGWSAPVLEDVP